MTTRILPIAEWPRLEGWEVGDVLVGRTADECKVLVVEDGEDIVGCWALVGLPHVEGIEVSPAHQGSGAVLRRLLSGMRHLLSEQGIQTVLTAAAEPDVAGLLEKFGAQKIPATFYALSFTGKVH